VSSGTWGKSARSGSETTANGDSIDAARAHSSISASSGSGTTAWGELLLGPPPLAFMEQLDAMLEAWVATVRRPGRLLLHDRLQVSGWLCCGSGS
jgi:hypothetical protein